MPSTPKAAAKDEEPVVETENLEAPEVTPHAAPPTGPTLYRWIGDYAAHFPDSTNSGLTPVAEVGGYITLNIDGSDPHISEFWDEGLLIDATGVTPPA
jgi:hypothetical protein